VADSTPSDYHLTYLRERWERDRSSRVFLQLAEESRRRGLLADALEVLQAGLAHHPGYLAAQVSLGRCWIEAGKPEAAAEVLTGVLAQDPTQAVASRLLIDVWLRLGEVDRTRAAIERCELLGVPPQELQGYRDRLAALSARQAAAPRGAASRAEIAEPAVEPEVEPADEPADEPEVEPAVEEAASAAEVGWDERPALADAAQAPSSLSPAAPARPDESSPAPPSGQVFALPPLASAPLMLPSRPGLRRRLRVAGGDPFQLPVPVPVAPAAGAVFALGLAAVAAPAAPPSASPETFASPPAWEEAAVPAPPAAPAPAFAPVEEEPLAPAAAAALLPEPAPDPLPTGEAPSPAEPGPVVEEPLAQAPPEELPWWRAAGTAPAPTVAPSIPAPPPAATAKPASEPVSGPAEALDPAALEEAPAPPPVTVPSAAAAREESAEPAPAAAASAPAPLPTGALEVQPSGALPAPELRPSDPGTATLGELYLRQGHLGEAGRIFHQVLERDPDNEAALRGLESIARQRTAQLGSGGSTSGGQPEVKGLTSRKIVLLQKYLHQLRAAAARQPESGSHVPGAAE
jgi:tetratricopeptide (TPR) repeat protein